MNNTHTDRLLVGLLRSGSLLVLLSIISATARGQSIVWSKQVGTPVDDRSFGVSCDNLGNVYIAGGGGKELTGSVNAGAFVSKYSDAGSLLWSRQVTSNAANLGVSADAVGNIYVSGTSNYDGVNPGGLEAFVAKYNSSGAVQWTRQLGTGSDDESYGVSADALGNVFITGYTDGSLGGTNAGLQDAWVSKYDAAGNNLWTQQLGSTSFDVSHGVSADGLGNAYIAGYTGGKLTTPSGRFEDAFVAKYDGTGNLLWTRQIGPDADDYAYGVAATSLGDVYIAGETGGSLGGPHIGPTGTYDGFVSRFNSAGDLVWSRHFGTTADDFIRGVAADNLGNIYISGLTFGSLGASAAGGRDAFLVKYDAAGNLLWTRQFGTNKDDVGYGVAKGLLGNVYLTGLTGGALVNPNAGGDDAFLIKLSDVPEPSSLCLAAVAGFALVVAMRRGHSAHCYLFPPPNISSAT